MVYRMNRAVANVKIVKNDRTINLEAAILLLPSVKLIATAKATLNLQEVLLFGKLW